MTWWQCERAKDGRVKDWKEAEDTAEQVNHP